MTIVHQAKKGAIIFFFLKNIKYAYENQKMRF